MSKLWAFFVIRREDRMITLEEAKKYLRVDSGDEDDIIQQELDAAENSRSQLWQSSIPWPISMSTGRKRIITP